ncbi:MAG: hypothetical protein NTV34_16955 [Proteobacteria bacterium]|nr:hypothetical protein [Pseudomonadota bacterium]
MAENDDVMAIKAAITDTNKALAFKAAALEADLRDRLGTLKTTAEQVAADVRGAVNAISPKQQIREHPLLFTGALFGLGVLVGSRSAGHDVSRTVAAAMSADSEQFVPRRVSSSLGIMESVAFGIFAAAAGEIVKKHFPKAEAQAATVQSAVIAEMTGRVLQKIKAL